MAAAVITLLNSGFGVVAALVVMLLACVVTYFVTRVTVEREVEALRLQLIELASLRNAVEELTTLKLSLKSGPRTPQVIEMPKPVLKPEPAKPVARLADSKSDELPHETLVVIAAAVAAFLGKSVRLRSARLVQPVGESPWAQQGRVFVQASHNLARA